MKHINYIPYLTSQNQREINNQPSKSPNLCYSSSNLQMASIKSEQNEWKISLPLLIKFKPTSKFDQDYDGKEDNKNVQSRKKSYQSAVKFIDTSHQNEEKINQLFADHKIQKSQQIQRRSSLNPNAIKAKNRHNRKFSQMRIIKTQISPQKGNKKYETIEPKQIDSLSKLLNYDRFVSERNNYSSVILLNPLHWKNKDMNKIIQNKVKMGILQRYKHRQNYSNETAV